MIRRLGNLALTPFIFWAISAFAAYDANGVVLGATEIDVKKAFPSAYCKPLEWTSAGADRRCDDAKISFGGVDARITFYLKKDSVQAFDLRFETKDLDKIVAVLKGRYGKPTSETKDERQGKSGREIYKALWEKDRDRAVLVAQLEKKRSQLTVSRGNWEEEIYRVR
jgi:hypothetical protein